LDDLTSVAEFIGEDSPHFAALTVSRIVARFEQAAESPYSGRIMPEKNRPELRELLWKEYRLVYQVREDHIEVIAVWHGRRLLRDLPES